MEKDRMQPAQNLALTVNPIDMVESIFASRSFELERRNANEVVVEVQGKWDNMLLFFAWESSMKCLHMSCLMNIDNKLDTLRQTVDVVMAQQKLCKNS